MGLALSAVLTKRAPTLDRACAAVTICLIHLPAQSTALCASFYAKQKQMVYRVVSFVQLKDAVVMQCPAQLWDWSDDTGAFDSHVLAGGAHLLCCYLPTN